MRELIEISGLFESMLIGARDDDLKIRQCESSEADAIIVKYHYSKKTTSNRFASFLVNDGEGVLQLGYGIRPKTKGILSPILTEHNWCEFDRMWLSDSMPKFSESRVIGLLIFYIKHKFPNIQFIITYADESVGNKGTIYRATNAVEIEGKEVDFYLLPSGERVHPVTMWHRHKTRTFDTMNKIYPGIIRIRGGNVQGDAPKEKLDSLRNLRQRRFIYPIGRHARKKLKLCGISVNGTRDATSNESRVRFSDAAPA